MDVLAAVHDAIRHPAAPAALAGAGAAGGLLVFAVVDARAYSRPNVKPDMKECAVNMNS